MSFDWVKPGVQCVCIDDDWNENVSCGDYSLPVRVPMLNEVLTIDRVRPFGSQIFLFFCEIPALQHDGPLKGSVAWHAACFRPLLKRPTDIGVFKKLLLPAGRKTVPA